MYSDVYDVINGRLAEIDVQNVGSALCDQPPLPAVQPWLVEDKKVEGAAGYRDHTWGIKVTVGHNEVKGDAQAEMFSLLSTIRVGFDGWLPPLPGKVSKGFAVITVRLEDFKDRGSTVYAVILSLRVYQQPSRPCS